MNCLITGCNVVNTHSGLWAVADMHEVAGAFVFICTTDGQDRIWRRGEYSHDKVVYLLGANWIERGNVIVIDAEECELNSVARGHIRQHTPGLSPDWGADK